jgi:hypothetical protein
LVDIRLPAPAGHRSAPHRENRIAAGLVSV